MPKNDYVDISSSNQLKKVYKSKNRKGRVVRIVVLVLAILCFVGGGACLYYYKTLDIVNYKALDPIETPKDPESTEVNTSLLSSSKVLNILLLGQDFKGDSSNKYGRSDTTVLLSIDSANEQIKLSSFQRDIYVTIPGNGSGKLNSAFSLGGPALTIKTIEANFGVKVDKYVTVDFDTFRDVIDVLGGVDIECSIDDIQYINAQIEVNNQQNKTDYVQYDKNKEKQVVHLNKYQALWYARNRGEEDLGGNPDYSFDGDDWTRTGKQRKLITTIIESFKTKADLSDIVEIVNKVGPCVTTNLKKNDITYLVSNAPAYLKYEMFQTSVPVNKEYQEGDGSSDMSSDTVTWHYDQNEAGSVIIIDDWNTVRTQLAEFVYTKQVKKASSNTNGATSKSVQQNIDVNSDSE